MLVHVKFYLQARCYLLKRSVCFLVLLLLIKSKHHLYQLSVTSVINRFNNFNITRIVHVIYWKAALCGLETYMWPTRDKLRPTASQRWGGGGGGGGSCSLVQNKVSLVFPCSLKVVLQFWCSPFPNISETQLLFPCSQLYFPFVPLFPIIFWSCSHVP